MRDSRIINDSQPPHRIQPTGTRKSKTARFRNVLSHQSSSPTFRVGGPQTGMKRTVPLLVLLFPTLRKKSDLLPLRSRLIGISSVLRLTCVAILDPSLHYTRILKEYVKERVCSECSTSLNPEHLTLWEWLNCPLSCHLIDVNRKTSRKWYDSHYLQ